MLAAANCSSGIAGSSWAVSVYTHTSRDPYSGFGLKLYVLPRQIGRPTAGPFDLNKLSRKEWILAKEIYPGRIISGSIEVHNSIGFKACSMQGWK